MYGDPPVCRYCGTPIQFIRTKKGNLMPVDGFSFNVVERDKGDNFIKEDGSMVRGVVVDVKGPATVKAWRPHFGTCPVRNKDRNRKAQSRKEAQEKQIRERIEKERAEAEAKAARREEKKRKEAEAREAADAQYSFFGT